MSDVVVGAIGLIVVVSIITALIVFLSRSEKEAEQASKKKDEDDEIIPAGNTRASRRAAERMRAGARRRKNAGAEVPEPEETQQEEDEDEGGEEEEVGKSHKARLAARKNDKKAMKAEQRQAREDEREAKEDKKVASKYEERRRQKDLEREEKEREEQEELEKIRLEQEKAAAAEFDKWKDMFTVEGGGTAEEEVALENQGLLADFINYIIKRKTVVLEDIAAEFGLRTQEVINRIQGLEAMGRLTGVMDDRGKFIYVSQEEMEKVAAYIKERGRVSIAELAQKSDTFVDLTGPAEIELSAEDVAAMDAEAADEAGGGATVESGESIDVPIESSDVPVEVTW